MSKKYKFNLDVISNIDEDIVNKNLTKRFELWHKKGKPRIKYIPIIAAAACFFMIASVLLLLLPGLTKQVPVYRGMTVSNTSPFATAKAISPEEIFALSNGNIQGIQTLKNDHGLPNVKDDEDENNKSTDPAINASGTSSMFYATSGEDFYITVHIDNPDKFEILSFTLNGEKYSSYMFEQGSNMENLVLKCNAGNAVGVIEYTIDAIKYVDGTNIKDVKIGGDQTISVGLYAEGIQPTAAVSNENITYDTLSFSALVTDEYDLIGKSEGTLTAYIYKGNELITAETFAVGENFSFKYEKLSPETTYTYKIVAEYDSLNGKGVESFTLYEKEFTTQTLINLEASYHKIDFSVAWHELASEKVINSIALYRNGEKVKDIDVNAAEIGDLLANNEYTLQINYTDKGIAYTLEKTFTTKAYSADISFTESSSEKHSVTFELNENDENELGEVSKIALWLGETLIETAESLDVRSFDGLLADNTYTVKITYVYDFLDGKGEQTIVFEKDIKTEAYAIPSLTFSSTNYTKDSVSFVLQATDTDNVGAISSIELWLGETLIKTAESVDISSFEELTPCRVYTVKAIYSYDLNDGKGVQTVTVSSDIITQSVGLEITDGVITGIGSCTDSTLCLNMPVADNAFEGNKNITKLYLGSGVSKIGAFAFAAAYGITDVTFSEHITNMVMSSTAFFCPDGSSPVVYIRISDTESWYNIEDESGSRGATIYKGSLYCNDIRLTSLSIPDTVTTLSSLRIPQNIKSITIPSSVTDISTERSLFYNHEPVEVINQSNVDISMESGNVLEIHNGASKIINKNDFLFYSYSGTNYLIGYLGVDVILSLPEDYNGQNYEIYERAFEGNYNIVSITVPENVTKIGDYAFLGCIKLVEVINHSSLSITKGGNGAAPIRNGHIGYYALEVHNGVSKIVNKDDYLFYYCYNNGTNYLLGYVGNDTELILPENYNSQDYSIYDYAFYKNIMIESVVIPYQASFLGQAAFQGCAKLTNITIPAHIYFNSRCFFGCCSLSSINFQGTVETLWEHLSNYYEQAFVYTGGFIVYCTDGTVHKDEIVS